MDVYYLLAYIGQGLGRERRIEQSLKINLEQIETRSKIHLLWSLRKAEDKNKQGFESLCHPWTSLLTLYLFVFLFSGIAVDKNGLMYFVDATMIRKVDQNGIISTLLGANDLTAVRPLSCDSSMDVSQVSKPTAHVINNSQAETGTWKVHLIIKSTSLNPESLKQTFWAESADSKY